MAYTRRIVIVCGYGCDIGSPLRPYLDKVVDFCNSVRPEVIILCGGATQRKRFPGRTEAEVMHNYLKGRLVHSEHWQLMFYIKDDSYTTYENIRDAARVVAELKMWPWSGLEPRLDEITIFCEATRALKVAILARYFLGFPPEHGEPAIRVETDTWELDDPLKELESARRTVMAINWPWLNYIQRCEAITKSMLR